MSLRTHLAVSSALAMVSGAGLLITRYEFDAHRAIQLALLMGLLVGGSWFYLVFSAIFLPLADEAYPLRPTHPPDPP